MEDFGDRELRPGKTWIQVDHPGELTVLRTRDESMAATLRELGWQAEIDREGATALVSSQPLIAFLPAGWAQDQTLNSTPVGERRTDLGARASMREALIRQGHLGETWARKALGGPLRAFWGRLAGVARGWRKNG